MTVKFDDARSVEIRMTPGDDGMLHVGLATDKGDPIGFGASLTIDAAIALRNNLQEIIDECIERSKKRAH